MENMDMDLTIHANVNPIRELNDFLSSEINNKRKYEDKYEYEIADQRNSYNIIRNIFSKAQPSLLTYETTNGRPGSIRTKKTSIKNPNLEKKEISDKEFEDIYDKDNELNWDKIEKGGNKEKDPLDKKIHDDMVRRIKDLGKIITDYYNKNQTKILTGAGIKIEEIKQKEIAKYNFKSTETIEPEKNTIIQANIVNALREKLISISKWGKNTTMKNLYKLEKDLLIRIYHLGRILRAVFIKRYDLFNDFFPTFEIKVSKDMGIIIKNDADATATESKEDRGKKSSRELIANDPKMKNKELAFEALDRADEMGDAIVKSAEKKMKLGDGDNDNDNGSDIDPEEVEVKMEEEGTDASNKEKKQVYDGNGDDDDDDDDGGDSESDSDDELSEEQKKKREKRLKMLQDLQKVIEEENAAAQVAYSEKDDLDEDLEMAYIKAARKKVLGDVFKNDKKPFKFDKFDQILNENKILIEKFNDKREKIKENAQQIKEKQKARYGRELPQNFNELDEETKWNLQRDFAKTYAKENYGVTPEIVEEKIVKFLSIVQDVLYEELDDVKEKKKSLFSRGGDNDDGNDDGNIKENKRVNKDDDIRKPAAVSASAENVSTAPKTMLYRNMVRDIIKYFTLNPVRSTTLLISEIIRQFCMPEYYYKNKKVPIFNEKCKIVKNEDIKPPTVDAKKTPPPPKNDLIDIEIEKTKTPELEESEETGDFLKEDTEPQQNIIKKLHSMFKNSFGDIFKNGAIKDILKFVMQIILDNYFINTRLTRIIMNNIRIFVDNGGLNLLQTQKYVRMSFSAILTALKVLKKREPEMDFVPYYFLIRNKLIDFKVFLTELKNDNTYDASAEIKEENRRYAETAAKEADKNLKVAEDMIEKNESLSKKAKEDYEGAKKEYATADEELHKIQSELNAVGGDEEKKKSLEKQRNDANEKLTLLKKEMSEKENLWKEAEEKVANSKINYENMKLLKKEAKFQEIKSKIEAKEAKGEKVSETETKELEETKQLFESAKENTEEKTKVLAVEKKEGTDIELATASATEKPKQSELEKTEAAKSKAILESDIKNLEEKIVKESDAKEKENLKSRLAKLNEQLKEENERAKKEGTYNESDEESEKPKQSELEKSEAEKSKAILETSIKKLEEKIVKESDAKEKENLKSRLANLNEQLKKENERAKSEKPKQSELEKSEAAKSKAILKSDIKNLEKKIDQESDAKEKENLKSRLANLNEQLKEENERAKKEKEEEKKKEEKNKEEEEKARAEKKADDTKKQEIKDSIKNKCRIIKNLNDKKKEKELSTIDEKKIKQYTEKIETYKKDTGDSSVCAEFNIEEPKKNEDKGEEKNEEPKEEPKKNEEPKEIDTDDIELSEESDETKENQKDDSQTSSNKKTPLLAAAEAAAVDAKTGGYGGDNSGQTIHQAVKQTIDTFFDILEEVFLEEETPEREHLLNPTQDFLLKRTNFDTLKTTMTRGMSYITRKASVGNVDIHTNLEKERYKNYEYTMKILNFLIIAMDPKMKFPKTSNSKRSILLMVVLFIIENIDKPRQFFTHYTANSSRAMSVARKIAKSQGEFSTIMDNFDIGQFEGDEDPMKEALSYINKEFGGYIDEKYAKEYTIKPIICWLHTTLSSRHVINKNEILNYGEDTGLTGLALKSYAVTKGLFKTGTRRAKNSIVSAFGRKTVKHIARQKHEERIRKRRQKMSSSKRSTMKKRKRGGGVKTAKKMNSVWGASAKAIKIHHVAPPRRHRHKNLTSRRIIQNIAYMNNRRLRDYTRKTK